MEFGQWLIIFHVRMKTQCLRKHPNGAMDLVSYPFSGVQARKHFKECLFKNVVMTFNKQGSVLKETKHILLKNHLLCILRVTVFSLSRDINIYCSQERKNKLRKYIPCLKEEPSVNVYDYGSRAGRCAAGSTRNHSTRRTINYSLGICQWTDTWITHFCVSIRTR